MKNKYELDKLSVDKRFKSFNITNVDRYITFLKDNLTIDTNELLIIVDLTIYNKENKILLSDKVYNYDYYKKSFIKMFMYNYNKNIKYLKKYIKIDKRDFDDLIKYLNNKKRIYSYFEDINNTNITFYLPIIINLEYPNS